MSATLLMWVVVIADLATGGRPDPPALREASILLDGSWRFHTGDDSRWADPGFNDSDWETIDLTAKPGSHDGDVGLPDYSSGWMARGHPGYQGYAWYRRGEDVPKELPPWVLLGPTLVEDGYEIYWNGHLLGGSGKLGPSPRLVGTRPLRFSLPAGSAGGTRGILALRVYMLPGLGRGAYSGGMHSPPILAPAAAGEALHRAQWERTIAGYVVDAVEPFAMLGVVALAWACRPRSSRQGFLAFASIALVLSAVRRSSNAIVSWTDLEDLRTYDWLAAVMWAPIVGAWTLAWNRWNLRPWKSIDALAVGIAAVGIIGAVTRTPHWATGSRIASIVLFTIIAARLVRGGSVRLLPAITWVSIVGVLFGGELLDPLGVPGIWFPFGIGVSRTQYIYALAIPLLALLVVQTLDRQKTDREREVTGAW